MNAPSNVWLRATAEFVVIVTGVLVALTVDQWVNGRQARSSELRYLVSLEEELRLDSLAFVDFLIGNLKGAEAALGEVRAVARGAEPFPDDTVRFLQTIRESSFSVSSFPASGVAYEAIVATGDFQLIGSDALRASLTDYYARKQLIETLIREDDAGFREFVRGYVPASSPGAGAVTDQDFRDFGLGAAADVVHTQEFLVGLNRHTSYVRGAIPRLEGMADLLGVLLQKVGAELVRLR